MLVRPSRVLRSLSRRDHLGLNIHRQDLSRRADGLGQAAAEITCAGANVGHGLTTPKPELADQLVGLFLGNAFGPFQPIGRFMAHDLGDLTAHVELADAIRVMGLVEAVAVGLAGHLSRFERCLQIQAGATKPGDNQAAPHSFPCYRPIPVLHAQPSATLLALANEPMCQPRT